RADAMVISQTPADALAREWAEHGIEKGVRLIAGQEMGTKTDHLRFAAAGKYPAEKILMIGDAPGDYKAAKANGGLFYPIVPGKEEESWKRFHDEALDRFFSGRFAGDYAKGLLHEFEAVLPENPSWLK
ncbi:MAG TPA: HAD family hydrolase, partial [Methylomirabilota bacterium]|nr:HAD family hydrolase [Methylomirabilota bacterium]